MHLHVSHGTPGKSEMNYTLRLREWIEGLSRSALPNKLCPCKLDRGIGDVAVSTSQSGWYYN